MRLQFIILPHLIFMQGLRGLSNGFGQWHMRDLYLFANFIIVSHLRVWMDVALLRLVDQFVKFVDQWFAALVWVLGFCHFQLALLIVVRVFYINFLYFFLVHFYFTVSYRISVVLLTSLSPLWLSLDLCKVTRRLPGLLLWRSLNLKLAVDVLMSPPCVFSTLKN